MIWPKQQSLHGYHQKHGVSKKEEFFGNPGKHYPLAVFSLVNMVKSQIGKQVLRQLFGVSPRDLPNLARSVLGIGSEEILLQPPIKSHSWPIYLLIMDPMVKKHAVRVLESWALKLCSEVQELGLFFVKGLWIKP